MANPFTVAAEEAKRKALQVMAAGLPIDNPAELNDAASAAGGALKQYATPSLGIENEDNPMRQAADQAGSLAAGMPISQAITNIPHNLTHPREMLAARDPKELALAMLFAGPKAKGFKAAQSEGRTFGNIVDKMDRFEIDDSAAVLTAPHQKMKDKIDALGEEYRSLFKKKTANSITPAEASRMHDVANEMALTQDALKAKAGKEITLADVLDHPELYKQYPHMKKARIVLDKTGQRHNASYGRGADGRDEIKLPGFAFDPNYTQATISKRFNSIIHEIQHAIQEREGFARGTNPGTQKLLASAEVNEKAYRDLMKNNPKYRALADQRESLPVGSAKREAIDEELRSISRKYIEDNGMKARDPIERYMENAGEIEARDAGSRARMTALERMQNEPYASQNIPVNKWLIDNRGSGTLPGKRRGSRRKEFIEGLE